MSPSCGTPASTTHLANPKERVASAKFRYVGFDAEMAADVENNV